LAAWYRRDADGSLVLHVHAQPGAKRTEVAGLHGEALKVRVAAPALEDRANAALIEFLAAAFGVARRDVSLLGGARSREKRFCVRGARIAPESLLA
jgi:uncharacterized protein (TIGR00251 family)